MIRREVGAGRGQSTVERGGGHGVQVTDSARRSLLRVSEGLARARTDGDRESRRFFAHPLRGCNLSEKGNCTPWALSRIDKTISARALDPYGAATHEVFNQPVELADY